MYNKNKPIPQFNNADEEREFWATHDSTEYIDWSKAASNSSFPHLKAMQDFTPLETTRLRLRRFIDSDLAPFMAYRNDPEVARYQSWERISEPEARAFLQEQKQAQPGVPGHWFQIAIELKERGILVGDCALNIKTYDERQAEIGYTLSRAYQRRGIASEAISCLLEYAFVALDLHRVIAITDCENAASIALLERLGLRREGHFLQNIWFKGKWGDEYLYAMLQEEWQNRRI